MLSISLQENRSHFQMNLGAKHVVNKNVPFYDLPVDLTDLFRLGLTKNLIMSV